jgi:hypothetical protein
MCPACIASAAVMAAGAGSTGGVLAVCIGKFKKASQGWSRSVSQNQGEIEGEIKWQPASKVAWSTRKSRSQ